MSGLFVLVFLGAMTFFGLTGLWVHDSRDGKDHRPGDWPAVRL